MTDGEAGKRDFFQRSILQAFFCSNPIKEGDTAVFLKQG